MIKISGLNKLRKDIDEIKKALNAISGTIGRVEFNPNDPESVESAIKDIEHTIDKKVGHLYSNSVVRNLSNQMKHKYRIMLLDRADQEKLKDI